MSYLLTTKLAPKLTLVVLIQIEPVGRPTVALVKSVALQDGFCVCELCLNVNVGCVPPIPAPVLSVITIILSYATPFPVPTPVAINVSPMVLLLAPTNVKSVVPTVLISYSLPIIKLVPITSFADTLAASGLA